MRLWDRIRAIFGRSSSAGSPEPPPPRGGPAPTLDEMRTLLRAGMTRDEFFTVLDDLATTRGLRVTLPTADDRLIGLPVAEGDQLLCFLPEGELNYVEYKGGVFLEKPE